MNILLVDDEASLCAVAKRHLERYGHTVVTHTCPLEAYLAFLQRPESFDVVISDYRMPVSTGEELLAKIKNLRPDVITVLYSGFFEPGVAERATEIGIDALLKKPLEYSQLHAALDGLATARTGVGAPSVK